MIDFLVALMKLYLTASLNKTTKFKVERCEERGQKNQLAWAIISTKSKFESSIINFEVLNQNVLFFPETLEHGRDIIFKYFHLHGPYRAYLDPNCVLETRSNCF